MAREITGRTQERLAEEVNPVGEGFLTARGLGVSLTKTRVTPSEEGWDCLGVHMRKFDGKLLTQPSQKKGKARLDKVRAESKAQLQARAGDVRVKLNPSIRGWAH